MRTGKKTGNTAQNNGTPARFKELRERAERTVNTETLPLHRMSKGEIEALIHELRVHQVELEMQNESLRQAQVDLEQSRTKYTDLFDFAPVGYLVFDHGGMVVEANLTATGMLQAERAYLVGKAFALFLQPASRDMWRFHCNRVFRARQAQECELELKRKDKARMIVRLRSQPVKNDKDEVIQCRTTMTNVTSLAEAEQATSQARRFAESVIDTVQEALLALDSNLKAISANRTFYDVFQVTPEETQGCYVYEIGHGQWNIPQLRTLLEDILLHDTSFEGFEVEHDFDRIGPRTMVLNARRIYSQTQETEMILLAIQDITIRRQQEREIHEHQQQLASLTEELLFTEERERHRLAVMLHDSIGQSLAFSRRELGALQKRVAAPMAEAIEDIKKQIDVAIRETRDLTFELSPTTLHTFGLEAAVEELSEQLAHHEGFQIHFEAPKERLPVTDQIKTLLYRAIRELLMNVAKHTGAQNVSVTIDRTDNKISVRVADDGQGFDVSALNHTTGEQQGFGIFSIRERLINVGGSFHIASKPGKGTEVTLIAPLDVPKGTE